MDISVEVDTKQDDLFWAELDKNCALLEKQDVTVGFWGGAKEERTGELVWKVAAYMEFGSTTRNIPARNFMRRGIGIFEFTEGKYVSNQITNVIVGNITPQVAMKRIGGRIRKHMKEVMESQNFQPITKAWKDNKASRGKSTDILFESGKLFRSMKIKVGDVEIQAEEVIAE